MSCNAINIWEGTGCRKHVRLTPYYAEGGDGTAVIICPGGSYFWLDRPREGHGVARWLQSQGISAFVLEYRVGGIPAFVTRHRILTRGNRFPDMLMDVQRAIELVRGESIRVAGHCIDPRRVGVIGFSAGGHLALMAATMYDSGIYEREMGREAATPLRPDFIAALYPVVSLVEACAHGRSRRGLLGDALRADREMCRRLSAERLARHDMPPVFLVNCQDDPVVDYHNSILMDEALTGAGVPHRYIRYSHGGHGFGADPVKAGEEAIAWRDEFIDWLRTTHI